MKVLSRNVYKEDIQWFDVADEFNGFALQMEFISLMRQDFFFIFKSAKH